MTRQEKAKANNEDYHLLRSHGLCVSCKVPTPPNARTGAPRSKCDHCMKAIIAWGERNKAAVHRAQGIYRRARRAALKKRGLCVDCAKRPYGRTTRCTQCEDLFNARYRPNRKGARARSCRLCRQRGHDIRTCKQRSVDRLSIDDYATARTYHEVG